jgi:hypothetical protein
MTRAALLLSWKTVSALALASATGMAGPSLAADRHYTGVAYDTGTAQVRYREDHWLFEDKGVPARLVLYRCSDGQPFARKTLRYSGTPWAPEFELVDNRDGYVEGARHVPGHWQVYVTRRAGARREEALLADRPDTVIDAGFDEYVHNHWDALGGEHAVSAAFLIPGRLAYLNIKLQPTERTERDGVAARQFRLSLDSWWGAVAPSVTLAYADANRQLLEFVGFSNIRDANGKQQRVRIEFSGHDEAPPSPEQIRMAQSEPLVSRCSAG